MGISGVSIGSLLIVFLIVLVVFGTKKMKNIGKDLGSVIKDFKKGMDDEPRSDHESQPDKNTKHVDS